jgi:putative lipase involved disintegration of autophagic bodies
MFLVILNCVFFITTFVVFTQCQIVPDMKNSTLVLSLAELAYNAYHTYDPHRAHSSTSWRNSTLEWQYVSSIGWHDNTDPRGNVYTDVTDKVAVVAFKGTSPGSLSDSEQDNVCFSCCCSRKCEKASCDLDSFNKEFVPRSYYQLAIESYRKTKLLLPDHQIWFVGHSLGAMVASTAALTLCEYSVGFASPGDKLFATRVDLPLECEQKIHHIGYHLDPLFKGECGLLCRLAGYYIDAKCHLGVTCTYNDTVTEPHVALRNSFHDVYETGFPWYIRYHTLAWLIDNILKDGRPVPDCVRETNCTESCDQTRS